MSLSCRLLAPEDNQTWDELVSSSIQGTVFHSSSWLQVTEQCYALPLRRWVVFDANGKVQGGFYLFQKNRSKLALGYAPTNDSATPYGGILTIEPNSVHTRKQESHLKEILQLAFEQYKGTKYNGTFLVLPPGFQDVRQFQWQGWQTKVLYTYILQLNAQGQDVFNKLDSTARNTIRKAEKTLEVRQEADLSNFYKLYRSTYERQGKTVPVGLEFLKEVMQRLEDKARLFMAYTPEGEAASGAVWLRDDRRSYYWLAASHSELARTGAPTLVLWHLVQASIGVVPEMDLVGANTDQIAFFKAVFNPVLEPYYGVEKTDGYYRLALALRQGLAKVRKKS